MRPLDPQKKVQMIRLLAKKVRVCLPIAYVSKILPLMLLEAVPNSPFFVVGLMNHAGKSIPVLDLAARLGLNRDQPYSLDTPLLLCSSGSQELALLADRILGLTDVAENSLQMSEQFDPATSLFLGSIAIGSELFLRLNAERILDCCLSTQEKGRTFDLNSPEAAKYELENE